MTELHIPVQLQQLEKIGGRSSTSSDRRRAPIGTIYFPEGTSANDVCVHISERDKPGLDSKTGLWLLQIKVMNPVGRTDLDDGCYSTVKDSKHKLTDSNKYVALHYTGPDIFLLQP